MRVRELTLDLFGHFTGRRFDFGEAGADSDFHLVYGPNEAGKTTTMEGFLRLLYGFGHREPYDFLHGRKNLRVSGVLEIDGMAQAFTRLPARQGSLRDGAGTALPESALAAHLGGLSAEDYRHLLCLDDETIEKGGEEIANARGDIGRLLFSAAAGIVDLTTVLESERAALDELYRPRASKTRMAELRREADELDREIRDRDMTASALRQLKLALRKAEARKAEARGARDALRTRLAETAARRRVLPLLREAETLGARIAANAHYPELPGIDPEELVALQGRQGTAQADLDRLDREIAEARAARDRLDVNAAHLALAERLDALDELRSRTIAAAPDLPKRRRAAEEAASDMARAARELGAAEGTDAARLVPGPAEIARLEAARDAMRDAHRARETAAEELAALDRHVAEAADRVRSLQAGMPERADLGALLERFDADRLTGEHAAASQALRDGDAQLSRALAALGHPGAPPVGLPHCPVDRITAETLATRHAELSERIARAGETLAAHSEDAAVKAARIESLTAGAGPIADAEAEAARTTRDTLWRAHRGKLDAATADAFEAAMAEVDRLAQARLSHARELGQLRQLEQDCAEAVTRRREAAERLDRLTAERAELDARVAALLDEAGLDARGPAQLLAWVEAHATAAAAAHDRDRLAAQHAPVFERAERLLAALAPHLPLEDPGFDAAIAAARRLAREDTRQREEIATATATLDQQRRELDRRKAAFASLDETAARADADWHALVADVFGGALDADTVARSLSVLRQLREHAAELARAQRQVDGMTGDQAQFAHAVTELATPLGLDGADPLTLFDRLQDLAGAARKAAEETGRLSRLLASATEARAAARQRLDEIEARKSEIGALFPDTVARETLDDLRRAVETARQTSEWRIRHADLEGRILSDLAVADLAAAAASLGPATPTGLDAEAASLEADLERAEQELGDATAAQATLARDLATVSDDADIAELVERRATLDLLREEVALDYLARDFGLRLAEEAIRRYRDTHRSGMLAATERAFAALTNGTYSKLSPQVEGGTEILVALGAGGAAKQVGDMSKGTRFQLYLALRAAAYEQLAEQGIRLPFFCDDIFETFDEDRTRAACRLMEQIGQNGQAIYLTHHRHVIDIARDVCRTPPVIHDLA